MYVPGREGLIAGEIAINVGAAHAASIDKRLVGIPHFLEHWLMFGASRNFGPREVNKRLPKQFALQNNASTGPAGTRFFRSGNGHVVPADLFWNAFAMVVDGTFFPKFDQET